MVKVTRRAERDKKPRIHVQSKLRHESFILVKATMAEKKCTQSEAIDILIYDLATT